MAETVKRVSDMTSTPDVAKTWLAEAVALHDASRSALTTIESWFEALEPYFDGRSLRLVPFAGMIGWALDLAEQMELLPEWYRYRAALSSALAAGLGEAVADLKLQGIALPELPRIVEKCFLRMWLASAYASQKTAADLDVERHDELIGAFRRTDRRLLSAHRERVLAAWNSRLPPYTDGVADSQGGVLTRQLLKPTRRLPLRRLFARIPELLLRVKPCMMMSPLSAAAYLPLDTFGERFDLVVFDEGSQVRPEFAAGALLRGKQAVVAGDLRQLPPTTFFRATGDTDLLPVDGAGGEEEMLESILAELISLPGLRQTVLRWHYRSQHESLIRFSNEAYYRNELITFPSPWLDSHRRAIRHSFVDGVYDRGGTRRNRAEAERVADLVAEHVRIHGGARSLGVVTLSLAQEQAIREELGRRLDADNGVLAEWGETIDEFADVPEPFFIKALERVQGDERDTIIISIGYGPDASGRLTQNFGPITQEGGERRLNVAITRSRVELYVVTSLRPTDIRIRPKTKQGLRDLRDFLSYVESVHEDDFAVDVAQAPSSPFASVVADALQGMGFQVARRLGMSESRVELAPYLPGQHHYLLAIGTDGEDYARLPTARDRERLHPQVLEQMGWQTERVWSKQWLEQPDSARKDLETAIARARRASPSEPVPVQPPDPTPPTLDPPPPDPTSGSGAQLPLPRWEDQIHLVPYSLYKPEELGAATDFRRRAHLRRQIEKIIKAEEPIHVDPLRRRALSCYDLHGVNRVEQRQLFTEGLKAVLSTKRFTRSGDFVRRASTDVDKLQPRSPPAGPTGRSFKHISLEEIAALIVQVLPFAYGVERTALARQVVHLLGYTRATRERKDRVESAVDLLLASGRAVARGQQIFTAEDTFSPS
jgi:hypothetical protein